MPRLTQLSRSIAGRTAIITGARRYGDPEEVAHATLSLVLPAASHINAVVPPVDGGMTIKND